MTIAESRTFLDEVTKRAEADSDTFFHAYFSRSEDKYEAWGNMDAGDALIVVQGLIRTFELSPTVIAAMEVHP